MNNSTEITNTSNSDTESRHTLLPKRRFIIGTAGHIDHGKSTLVKALTGSDPDRLKEEKQRGITIELGFAELDLPGGIMAGIVDVPGHEKFIRQMIAGASGIDVALVCIACDDGVMPQTREHLAVLQLLDIPACIVALTKCDIVDADWQKLVQEEIRNELNSTIYKNAPIIPISALNNTGLEELKKALADYAQSTEQDTSSANVRMPIDRVFTIKGAGTVITGTLWQGTVHENDELELLPEKQIVRVRGVQIHGRNVELSTPGTRTALNLTGLDKKELHPGDFLVTPGTLQASDRFDAQFTYDPILSAKKPLKSGTHIRISHGTREVIGRLLLMNNNESLDPGETTFVQIRLDTPLPLSRSDHFVVRLLSPARVIGGGKVLNPHPRRRTILTKNDNDLLDALVKNDEKHICAAIIDSSTVPVSLQEIEHITGYSQKKIRDTLTHQTTGKGKPLYLVLKNSGKFYFARKPIIQKLVATLENILLEFHANNPSELGISKGALEQQFPYHIEHACFEALLKEALVHNKLILQDGKVSHPQASAGARSLEAKAAQTIESILSSYDKTPPTIDVLIAESGLNTTKGSQAILTLEKLGKVKRISKTLCFTQQTLDSFWTNTKAYLEEHGSGTATQLKEAMGTSRKYAIPLLEYFDAQKLTIRQQDMRTLAKNKGEQ